MLKYSLNDINMQMNQLQGQAWLHSRGKRTEDLALAFGVLPIAGAPTIIGALAVRVIDGVNPLFIQQRLGLNNELFNIYKLRTMPNVHEDTPSGGLHNDPRASAVGKVLRRLRIDEAPQLKNIWDKQMSVVGPRALLPVEFDNAKHILDIRTFEDWKRVRGLALPGIFDEFGARYHNGEMTDDPEEQLKQRVELETSYITEEASLHKDIEILRNTGRLFLKMALPLGEAQ